MVYAASKNPPGYYRRNGAADAIASALNFKSNIISRGVTLRGLRKDARGCHTSGEPQLNFDPLPETERRPEKKASASGRVMKNTYPFRCTWLFPPVALWKGLRNDRAFIFHVNGDLYRSDYYRDGRNGAGVDGRYLELYHIE